MTALSSAGSAGIWNAYHTGTAGNCTLTAKKLFSAAAKKQGGKNPRRTYAPRGEFVSFGSIENRLFGLADRIPQLVFCGKPYFSFAFSLPERLLGFTLPGFALFSTLHGSRFLSLCHETKCSLPLRGKVSGNIVSALGPIPFPKIYLHFFAGSLWSDGILPKETHCLREKSAYLYLQCFLLFP